METGQNNQNQSNLNLSLVDEFDKLQRAKKELEAKELELKGKLIELAREKNTEVLTGTHKTCLIKPYEKVVFPENKEELIRIIKEKGLYERFSSINYLKLASPIVKNEIDKEISDLVRKEKAFRIFLRDRGV